MPSLVHDAGDAHLDGCGGQAVENFWQYYNRKVDRAESSMS